MTTDTTISAATIASIVPPTIQRPIFHRDDMTFLIVIVLLSVSLEA
jgi:hypothetical protein